ncbi:phage virion morphogenesis protein [Thalassococcus sp. CAU 1522]|uniref:Phage virion morphogenesis protein n=1 Tax=Thalassococcus arenae TaxID=2851652 RepID=A0ABS6NAG3_9RHOB|nr:phage virion morphogenesis protein [Thalassococcus arenae]MBV2360994.1 phage virion morphogenesis protein [Thalassococcus arenae]
MIREKIQIDEITVALSAAADALEDMTPLFEDIGMLMEARTKANFLKGQAPDGSAWAPKSMATIEKYRRTEGSESVPMNPLIGTSSRLMDNINHQARPDGVDWGSDAIYAAVMHFGAKQGEFGARIGKDKNGRDFFMSIPWGDIPARPFLGIGPEDENAILQTIENYLREAVGQ